MSPETTTFIFAMLAIVMVFLGAANLISLVSFETQKNQAEAIFRRRAVDSEEEVKQRLSGFFRKIRKSELFAIFSFALSFIFTIQAIKKLWPGSVGETVFSLLVLIILYAVPFLSIMFAEMQTQDLKKDIMSRFDG